MPKSEKSEMLFSGNGIDLPRGDGRGIDISPERTTRVHSVKSDENSGELSDGYLEIKLHVFSEADGLLEETKLQSSMKQNNKPRSGTNGSESNESSCRPRLESKRRESKERLFKARGLVKKDDLSRVTGRQSQQDQAIIELLRDVVRKCTNADSSNRPSASELHEKLSTHLNNLESNTRSIQLLTEKDIANQVLTIGN